MYYETVINSVIIIPNYLKKQVHVFRSIRKHGDQLNFIINTNVVNQLPQSVRDTTSSLVEKVN